MNNLVDSILSMSLDVYYQNDTQDLDTGAIKKEWTFYKTVSCHAKGVISNSASRTADRQQFSNRYVVDQLIEIRTEEKLTARQKITNIRDQQNNYIWTELDFPTETPTVFEVIGTTPMTDPFGNVISYNSLVKRSENQQIGL